MALIMARSARMILYCAHACTFDLQTTLPKEVFIFVAQKNIFQVLKMGFFVKHLPKRQSLMVPPHYTKSNTTPQFVYISPIG
jgi:hypothetical protein